MCIKTVIIHNCLPRYLYSANAIVEEPYNILWTLAKLGDRIESCTNDFYEVLIIKPLYPALTDVIDVCVDSMKPSYIKIHETKE